MVASVASVASMASALPADGAPRRRRCIVAVCLNSTWSGACRRRRRPRGRHLPTQMRDSQRWPRSQSRRYCSLDRGQTGAGCARLPEQSSGRRRRASAASPSASGLHAPWCTDQTSRVDRLYALAPWCVRWILAATSCPRLLGVRRSWPPCLCCSAQKIAPHLYLLEAVSQRRSLGPRRVSGAAERRCTLYLMCECRERSAARADNRSAEPGGSAAVHGTARDATASTAKPIAALRTRSHTAARH